MIDKASKEEILKQMKNIFIVAKNTKTRNGISKKIKTSL